MRPSDTHTHTHTTALTGQSGLQDYRNTGLQDYRTTNYRTTDCRTTRLQDNRTTTTRLRTTGRWTTGSKTSVSCPGFWSHLALNHSRVVQNRFGPVAVGCPVRSGALPLPGQSCCLSGSTSSHQRKGLLCCLDVGTCSEGTVVRVRPDWTIRLEQALVTSGGTLMFLSHAVVRASEDVAVLAVKDDGPGGLLGQAASEVFFCSTWWR